MNFLKLVLCLLILLPLASAQAQTVREIDLSSNDIVYDPVSAEIYVSVPQNGTSPNAIAAIDPVSGSVQTFTPLVDEPGKLALSDDGQFLYLGLTPSGVSEYPSAGRVTIATHSGLFRQRAESSCDFRRWQRSLCRSRWGGSSTAI